MILQRIRQFYYAITGRLSSEDREKITQYLPAEAVSLFDAMHPADQFGSPAVPLLYVTLQQIPPSIGIC